MLDKVIYVALVLPLCAFCLFLHSQSVIHITNVKLLFFELTSKKEKVRLVFSSMRMRVADSVLQVPECLVRLGCRLTKALTVCRIKKNKQKKELATVPIITSHS